MYDIIPPDAKAKLMIAKEHSRLVFMHGVQGPGCSNCGGTGEMFFFLATAGPFHDPRSMKIPVHHVENQGWYETETHAYPCPVCTDRDALIRYYWDTSGLLEEERGWHVDFTKGEEGKANAIMAANELLSQTPVPKGWVLFYGSYGVGKSGLLKSLVASFTRAGIEAKYYLAADLLAEIRATYDERSSLTEAEIRAKITRYQFLAIDEVDRIPDTDWSKSTMASILDYRHRVRDIKALACATNADPETMPGMEYLASRFRDARRVLMGGRDMRGTT